MKENETQEMSVQKVIDWCDKESKNGNTVSIGWEGGSDSGWIYVRVNDEDVNSPEAEWLIDRMSECLDYGSWAGEFNASGYAEYDSPNKVFMGTDTYSEEEEAGLDLKSVGKSIQIKIPKKYYFETLNINLDNVSDGNTPSFTARVRNGVLEDKLVKYLDKLEQDMSKTISNLFWDMVKETVGEDVEISSNYQEFTVNREDFAKETETDYIYEIDNLLYHYHNGNDKDVCIDLNDYIND